MSLKSVAGKPMDQRNVDQVFRIVCFPGSEKVQYVTCRLCGEKLFDDARDKDIKPSMLTKIGVLHLNLSHDWGCEDGGASSKGHE